MAEPKELMEASTGVLAVGGRDCRAVIDTTLNIQRAGPGWHLVCTRTEYGYSVLHINLESRRRRANHTFPLVSIFHAAISSALGGAIKLQSESPRATAEVPSIFQWAFLAVLRVMAYALPGECPCFQCLIERAWVWERPTVLLRVSE